MLTEIDKYLHSIRQAPLFFRWVSETGVRAIQTKTSLSDCLSFLQFFPLGKFFQDFWHCSLLSCKLASQLVHLEVGFPLIPILSHSLVLIAF